jgi:hypothetical protein
MAGGAVLRAPSLEKNKMASAVFLREGNEYCPPFSYMYQHYI